jgi:uncharacterized protein (TIGR02246 family)
MKQLSLIIATFGIVIVAHAQTKADEDAVRAIPRSMCDAWAKHDAHEMAKFMAEDVDFVTVGATLFHGRSDYEKYHTRVLSGRFKESRNTVLETMVRFLRPDLALLHFSWTIEGDKNADGFARPKRFGLMTMLAEKQKGTWLVIAAQNTNAGHGAPEADDIKLPIRLPKDQSKP